MTNPELREAIAYCKRRAMRCVESVLDDDRADHLAPAAQWAVLADFLNKELVQRESV